MEMAGASLTIFRLDDELARLLDAPGPLPILLPGVRPWRPSSIPPTSPLHARRVAAALKADQSMFTELDQAVGDGDLGITAVKLAEALELRSGPVWRRPRPVPCADRDGAEPRRSLYDGHPDGDGADAGGKGGHGQGIARCRRSAAARFARQPRASKRAAKPVWATRRFSTRCSRPRKHSQRRSRRESPFPSRPK